MHSRQIRINPRRFVRRRKLLAASGWVVLLLLLLSAAAEHFGWVGLGKSSSNDWEQFDRRQFMILRVIDGDTVELGSLPTAVSVRLIGIDAPELRHPDGSPPDHWAERACQYTRARSEGKSVTIRVDQTQTRDRYGRLLAYVYLSDTEMLNLALVRDGQAYADRRFKHTFRPQFDMAENDARRQKRGLWKDVTEAQMPAWRREWLRQVSATP